jgi:uncharacterized protein YndB with AHSA1/START domain
MLMWILGIVGGVIVLLVLLCAVLAILGSRVPVEHVAAVSVRVSRPIQEVWNLIADLEGHATWASGVTAVERLPDQDGKPAYRQRMGRNAFVLVTESSEPPNRLRGTISDDHGPFSGSWEYRLTPDGDGCRVTLTERGRVTQAMARGVMRHIVGYHIYIRRHLASIARKFGETAEVVIERV